MQAIIEKAKKIRLMIFDVDGVLSTGMLFYTPDGTEAKTFHVHDGQGIKLLQKSGVTVAIITAHETHAVTKRMKDLDVEHVYQNQADKVIAYEDIKQKLNLTDEEIAYAGDDLPDLPVLKRVGLSITVANAPKFIRAHVNWVTKCKGGKGAAREICELIMQAQGTFDAAIASYLQR